MSKVRKRLYYAYAVVLNFTLIMIIRIGALFTFRGN